MAISIPLADIAANFQNNFQAAQAQIGERSEAGELTLAEARIGKLLSQTGTWNIFQTLQEAGVETVDVADHDASDPVASIGAGLHASITALDSRGLDIPNSEYDPALDQTGVSNDHLHTIEQTAGLGQDAIIVNGTGDTTEEQVDALAREIQKEILEKPDWDEREYGSIIYRTADGEIKSSPLTRGETVAEAPPGQPPSTQLDIPDDLANGGEILALVHNHPDVGYNNHDDDNNRNPSDGDWHAFRRIDEIDLGDADDMALYIIDKAGHMREYHDHDAADHNGDKNPNEPNNTHEVDYDHGAEL